jgi:hypothetical protein
MDTDEIQMNPRAAAKARARMAVQHRFASLGSGIGLRLGRGKAFCPAIKK